MSSREAAGVLAEPQAAERRALQFASLDQVMPDVDNLLNGYRKVGQWSLGQICNHLGISLRGSVEGFDGRAPWLFRKTLGLVFKRKIFKTGKMKAGIKLPERFLPKPNLDDRAEAEAFRACLYLFAANTDPCAEHPFFGPFTREEWTRLHCIHAAHHLSFLWPCAKD